MSLLLTALLLIFSCYQTLAAWRVETATINMVSMDSVTGEITEVYEQNPTIYPGAEVEKVVRVKNTGTAAVFVRVKITKLWEDPALPANNILIDFNQTDWYYDAADGYFYYRRALLPGESTQPLMESFRLDGSSGSAYRGKTASIVVSMECIQANEAGAGYWGGTLKNLGVRYVTGPAVNVKTTVHFVSPEKGFIFEINNGDLFANFKKLLPGDSRSQEIEVKNIWSEGVEIFLRAEDTQQQGDAQTLRLLERLLKEYAAIRITDESGKVIYEGPVWGKPDSDLAAPASMRHQYSLGSFAPNQAKKLLMSLSLDERMDNELRALLGRIKWVFSASGSDTRSVSVSKVWAGADSPPPGESILVQLYRGGVPYGNCVTLNAGNRWFYTWEGLDPDGPWTVDEFDVAEGYAKTISGSASTGFVITNTRDPNAPKRMLVNGGKTWNHGSNPAGKWPKSIALRLSANGVFILQKEVGEAEHWSWSIRMDKYGEDGKEIVYTVDEAPVNDYIKAVDGYNVINTYKPGDPTSNNTPNPATPKTAETPVPKWTIPKTGDGSNLWLWVALMAVSATMLPLLLAWNRKVKKQARA